jgi:hypothetical protein
MQQIQQRHNGGRVGDEMKGIIALGVGYGRVGVVCNEKVNDV